MDITVDQAGDSVAVAVMSLHGELDASNFERVVDQAEELYNGGTRNIVVDMRDMPFMSSSGLVALHSIVVLMRGGERPSLESGWGAFHAIDRDRDEGIKQQSVKLLGPQPKVERTLQMTGMDEFFEIYQDPQAAIDSYQ